MRALAPARRKRDALQGGSSAERWTAPRSTSRCVLRGRKVHGRRLRACSSHVESNEGDMVNEKKVFRLVHAEARRRAMACVADAPEGMVVEVKEPTRTLEQNAAQWPYLDAFSRQLRWPVNGEMVRMDPEEWKDVLTAAFQGETVRLAMGLNGGVVMLGMRTSRFGKKRFGAWLEFLIATAAMRGVEVYPDEVEA